jgi:hypothetical protein
MLVSEPFPNWELSLPGALDATLPIVPIFVPAGNLPAKCPHFWFVGHRFIPGYEISKGDGGEDVAAVFKLNWK